MNEVILTGRFTNDPKVAETANGKKYARFTLAVDRNGEGTDFPSCIIWDNRKDKSKDWFVEKHCHKGGKYLVEGRIQTGSYEGKNGKVYTTDVVVSNIEFLESKKADGSEGQPDENPNDGFMNIPDGIDEEMPFA